MDVPTRRLLGRCDDLCIIRADYHPAFYLDTKLSVADDSQGEHSTSAVNGIENKVSQVIERLPLLPIERSHKKSSNPPHEHRLARILSGTFNLFHFHSPRRRFFIRLSVFVRSERAQFFFFFLYVKQKIRSSRKNRRLHVCALCTRRFLSSPFILALRNSRKLRLGNIHL